MSTPPATTADFKDRFDRAFVFGETADTVRDKDIERGFVMAASNYRALNWPDVAEQKEAFLLCAAHFVELDVQAAGGLSADPNGKAIKSTGGGIIQNVGVGGVNVGYLIPESFAKSPVLAPFLKTNHGQLYLQMFAPKRAGNIITVSGEVSEGGGPPNMYIPPVPPPDDI